jgi:hypothetical protein
MSLSNAVKFEFVFAAITFVMGTIFLYRGDSPMLAKALVACGVGCLIAASFTLLRSRHAIDMSLQTNVTTTENTGDRASS